MINLQVISAQLQMKCLSSKLLKRTCWWSCLITFTPSSYGNQWMGIGRITSRQTDKLIRNRWLGKVWAIQCWWLAMAGSYMLRLVKLELSFKNLPLAGQISPSTNKMCQFWELRTETRGPWYQCFQNRISLDRKRLSQFSLLANSFCVLANPVGQFWLLNDDDLIRQYKGD